MKDTVMSHIAILLALWIVLIGASILISPSVYIAAASVVIAGLVVYLVATLD